MPYKNGCSVLPSPREDTTEEKNTYSDQCHPTYSEDHKLFKQIRFMPQDTSRSTQTMQRGTENLEWEETIGSLTFATIRELRLFETDKAAVMWCKMVPSQSKFSVSLALH